MSSPIDQDKDVAVGITLPLRLGNSGYFEQSYTTLEQVKSNVINLLLTIPGERYMQPDFGSNLYKHLFEQLDEFVIEEIQDSIKDALEIWLPFVIIEKLEVTDGGDLNDNQSYHTIKVSLDISIKADPDATANITFKALETGNISVESRSYYGSAEGQKSNKSMVETYKEVNRFSGNL